MSNIQLKMAEINKKYKADIIQVGTQISKIAKIPFSSPTANFITYGGVPIGKITELFGGEGGGKTTSALDICANAQQLFEKQFNDDVDALNKVIEEQTTKGTKEGKKLADKANKELQDVIDKGKKLVAYVDTEQTLDVEWAQKLGVDTEALILVKPQEQTAEQVLEIIKQLIATGDIGLCVLDSIPCLVPQQIYDESLEKKAYGGISQPLTIFSSKILPYLVQNECAFIGINQIREDLSSMYNTISTPGGRAWKHACSLRLRFKKDTLLDENNGELSSRAENPAGNKVQIEVVKTKVCKPDRKLGYYTLNYTTGIDAVNDTITVATQYGLLQKEGSWFTFLNEDKTPMEDDGGKIIKMQGQGRVNIFLNDHPEVFEQLKDRVQKEMYGEC